MLNFDESSLPLKTLGPYSYQKKSSSTIPRDANSFCDKSRITIAVIISKAGEIFWKPLVVDNNFTRGLECNKKFNSSDDDKEIG